MVKKPVIFIDRDGVINKKMPEGDYVKEWKEFRFLPQVFEFFRSLQENGFLTIVVTNQRCLARGIITEEKLREIHEKMVEEIKRQGGNIDAIYFCPHEISDNCNCRKPKIGLLLRAKKEFNINLRESFLIGDKTRDILAGKRAGCRTILVQTSYGGKDKLFSVKPDFTVNNLFEAVKIINKKTYESKR